MPRFPLPSWFPSSLVVELPTQDSFVLPVLPVPPVLPSCPSPACPTPPAVLPSSAQPRPLPPCLAQPFTHARARLPLPPPSPPAPVIPPVRRLPHLTPTCLPQFSSACPSPVLPQPVQLPLLVAPLVLLRALPHLCRLPIPTCAVGLPQLLVPQLLPLVVRSRLEFVEFPGAPGAVVDQLIQLVSSVRWFPGAHRCLCQSSLPACRAARGLAWRARAFRALHAHVAHAFAFTLPVRRSFIVLAARVRVHTARAAPRARTLLLYFSRARTHLHGCLPLPLRSGSFTARVCVRAHARRPRLYARAPLPTAFAFCARARTRIVCFALLQHRTPPLHVPLRARTARTFWFALPFTALRARTAAARALPRGRATLPPRRVRAAVLRAAHAFAAGGVHRLPTTARAAFAAQHHAHAHAHARRARARAARRFTRRHRAPAHVAARALPAGACARTHARARAGGRAACRRRAGTLPRARAARFAARARALYRARGHARWTVRPAAPPPHARVFAGSHHRRRRALPARAARRLRARCRDGRAHALPHAAAPTLPRRLRCGAPQRAWLEGLRTRTHTHPAHFAALPTRGHTPPPHALHTRARTRFARARRARARASSPSPPRRRVSSSSLAAGALSRFVVLALDVLSIISSSIIIFSSSGSFIPSLILRCPYFCNILHTLPALHFYTLLPLTTLVLHTHTLLPTAHHFYRFAFCILHPHTRYTLYPLPTPLPHTRDTHPTPHTPDTTPRYTTPHPHTFCPLPPTPFPRFCVRFVPPSPSLYFARWRFSFTHPPHHTLPPTTPHQVLVFAFSPRTLPTPHYYPLPLRALRRATRATPLPRVRVRARRTHTRTRARTLYFTRAFARTRARTRAAAFTHTHTHTRTRTHAHTRFTALPRVRSPHPSLPPAYPVPSCRRLPCPAPVPVPTPPHLPRSFTFGVYRFYPTGSAFYYYYLRTPTGLPRAPRLPHAFTFARLPAPRLCCRACRAYLAAAAHPTCLPPRLPTAPVPAHLPAAPTYLPPAHAAAAAAPSTACRRSSSFQVFVRQFLPSTYAVPSRSTLPFSSSSMPFVLPQFGLLSSVEFFVPQFTQFGFTQFYPVTLPSSFPHCPTSQFPSSYSSPVLPHPTPFVPQPRRICRAAF